MEGKFLYSRITYDGTQLRSGWIEETAAIEGDAIACFIGPADVKLTEMVDLDDVRRGVGIRSASMLHFIIEHPGCALPEMVWRQRLFMAISEEALLEKKVNVVRSGDDLFVSDEKMSVSIATSSPTSGLIHAGINVDASGAPVPACGLDDFDVEAQSFGKLVMGKYIEEVASASYAVKKVRRVK